MGQATKVTDDLYTAVTNANMSLTDLAQAITYAGADMANAGNFEVPTALPGVDPAILDPRDTYADAAEWEVKAKDLAERFVKNFAKYEGNEAGKALVSAGPQA